MGDVIQMRDFETAEERQIKADRIHNAVMLEVFGSMELPPDWPYDAPLDDPA